MYSASGSVVLISSSLVLLCVPSHFQMHALASSRLKKKSFPLILAPSFAWLLYLNLLANVVFFYTFLKFLF